MPQSTVTMEIALCDRAGIVRRRAIVHWPAGKPFTVQDLVETDAIGWRLPAGWSFRVQKHVVAAHHPARAANTNRRREGD